MTDLTKLIKVTLIKNDEETSVYMQCECSFEYLLGFLEKTFKASWHLPRRIYWIDNQNDKIYVYDQNSYAIFRALSIEKRIYLKVRTVSTSDQQKQLKSPQNEGVSIIKNQEVSTTKKAGTSTIQKEVFLQAPATKIAKASSATKKNDNHQPKENTGEEPKRVVHPKIVCDGCDKDVVGFRYKCVQCYDYDLCMDCETQMKHANHVMFRIPVPMDNINFDRRTLKKMKHGKLIREGSCRGQYDRTNIQHTQNNASPPTECRYGRRNHRMHREPNDGDRCLFRRYNKNRTAATFDELYTMFRNLADGAEEPNESEESDNDSNAEQVTSKTATTAAKKVGKAENIPNRTSVPSTPTAPVEELAVDIPSLIVNMFLKKDFNKAQTNTSNAHNMETSPSAENKTQGSDEGKQTGQNIPTAAATSNIDNSGLELPLQFIQGISGMVSKVLQPFAEMSNGLNQANFDFNKTGTTSTFTSQSATSVLQPNSGINKTPESNPSAVINPTLVINDEDKKIASDADSIIINSDGDSVEITSEPVRNISSRENSIESNVLPTIMHDRSTSPSIEIGWMMVDKVNEEQINIVEEPKTTTPISFGIQSGQSVSEPSTILGKNFRELNQELWQHENSNNTSQPTVDNRAEIVFHPQRHINEAVHAMMAMGFSNDGKYLTSLLESVNGDVSMAIDVLQTSK